MNTITLHCKSWHRIQTLIEYIDGLLHRSNEETNRQQLVAEAHSPSPITTP